MKLLEHYHPAPIRPEDQTDLLSVIVTAYNIEDYIERGVRSICEQTYRHLEILVVDDGKIVQQGKHDELITQKGIYADFVLGRKEAIGWKL